MNAKEMQGELIKTCLKPLLKQHAYLTRRQTWWKNKGDFFIIIDLQNFSWNSKDDVNFCFNIGIALKALVKDLAKPSYADLSVQVRESACLLNRETQPYRNHSGYQITSTTNLGLFTNELKIDFEDYILPALEQLQTLKDCMDFYNRFPFLSEQLKNVIAAAGVHVC